MAGGTAEPPLRVLGWPAFSNRREQPYNALLYEHLAALGVDVAEYSAARLLGSGCSVLHLHWPDRRVRDPSLVAAAARSAALLALLDAARLRGTRVVWTIHNLEAHGPVRHPRIERRFWSAFTRRLDAVIALTGGGLAAARERHPALRSIPGHVIPHGHYRGAYPDDVTAAEARAVLEIGERARVIAFFGQVRDYKGVDHLIRAFRGVRDPEAVLLVAGGARPRRLAEALRAEADGDPRIRLHLRFVPDREVQVFLRAADLVALPYRAILNSGSALLALSFDRPTLVPLRGALGELAARVGADWVRTYPGELTSGVLEEALAWAAERDRPGRAPLTEFGWNRIAERTAAAYREVAAPNGRDAGRRSP